MSSVVAPSVGVNLVFVLLFSLLLIDKANGGCTTAKDYQKAGMKLHNEYRIKHQVVPIQLDDKLNQIADECAAYYVKRSAVDHSCSRKGKAGENLYRSWNMELKAVSAVKRAVDNWYREIDNYDFTTGEEKDRNRGPVGHFTQVVWKDSIQLGIGWAKKTGEMDEEVVVALYSPPGNVGSRAPKNVFPAGPPESKSKDAADDNCDNGSNSADSKASNSADSKASSSTDSKASSSAESKALMLASIVKLTSVLACVIFSFR